MTELTRTASEMFVNTARFLDAYHAVMQPLCTEAKLPPAALDIILYLANIELVIYMYKLSILAMILIPKLIVLNLVLILLHQMSIHSG